MPTKIINSIVLVALFIAITLGVYHWGVYKGKIAEEGKYKQAIIQLQNEADKKLNDAIERNKKLETDLTDTRNRLEGRYEQTIAEFNARVAKLRADVRADIIRLYDPGATRNQTTTPRIPTEANCLAGADSEPGLLSRQTTEFLFDSAVEADGILEKLRLCTDWSDKLESTLETWKRDNQ